MRAVPSVAAYATEIAFAEPPNRNTVICAAPAFSTTLYACNAKLGMLSLSTIVSTALAPGPTAPVSESCTVRFEFAPGVSKIVTAKFVNACPSTNVNTFDTFT